MNRSIGMTLLLIILAAFFVLFGLMIGCEQKAEKKAEAPAPQEAPKEAESVSFRDQLSGPETAWLDSRPMIERASQLARWTILSSPTITTPTLEPSLSGLTTKANDWLPS